MGGWGRLSYRSIRCVLKRIPGWALPFIVLLCHKSYPDASGVTLQGDGSSDHLSLSMKALLFALALGVALSTGGTGGGSTTPKGGVLDIVSTGGTGGGSTTPKGGVLDIASTGGTGGGSTTPKGGVLDIA